MIPAARLLRIANVCPAAAIKGSHRYSTDVGDAARRSINESAGLPERWKRLWVLTMKRRAEIEGPEPPTPRSAQRNWDYNAELSAFQSRLHINCPINLLSSAFTEPVSDEMSKVEDYSELCVDGKQFTDEFISHYVKIALPLVPPSGQQSVQDYLLDSTNIAFLAKNLGYLDLLQCVSFPPTDEVICKSFLASIEVINLSEGPVSAGRFILDFVIPQLVGKDILHDIWKPENPMKLLVEEMEKRSLPPPEARLVRHSGINTVTPVFFIALFSGKKFLTESGGESIPLAETDAAKLALKRLYNIEVGSEVLPMGHSVDDHFLSHLFEPLLAKFTERLHLKEDQPTSVNA